MLRSFIASTLRNMARHKLFTAIVVGGLGLAFAAAILITLFVFDKFHAESFVPESHRIYLVGTSIRLKDQPAMEVAVSAPEVAEIIRTAAPGIEGVTRRHLVPMTPVIHGQVEATEAVDWVDPNFFQIFRIPAFLGDPASAFTNPESVVITRQIAKKYFGVEAALGRRLTLNRKQTLLVTAVLEDLPLGTSLNAQIFASAKASFSPLAALEQERAKAGMDIAVTSLTYTYFLLRPGIPSDEVRTAISNSERVRSKYPELMTIELPIVALNDLHLKTPGAPNTSLTVLAGISLIGVIVLFVAGINFVNLMTARARMRAREIGIRKVAGAERRHLVLQFMGESFVCVAAALLVGLALVELTESFWAGLLYQSFSLSMNMGLFWAILASALVFALLAGAYPAFVLSALSPQKVFRGLFVAGSRSRLIRELLVGMQFALLVIILICTVVISSQVRFSTRDNLSFSVDDTMVLFASCTPALVNEVRSLPGVEAHFCSSVAPLGQFSIETTSATTDGGKSISLSGLVIDLEFFGFYGIRPLAGRLLSEQFGTDQLEAAQPGAVRQMGPVTSVIINESARVRLGFATPEAAVGQVVKRLLPDARDAIIVGVVPDFVIAPVREKIRPLFFFVDRSRLTMLSIRLSESSVLATTKSIAGVWKGQGHATPFNPIFLRREFDSAFHDVIVQSFVFQGMALVAMVTAMFGLLGLSVFNVQARTKEIGIRKALGASRFDISRMLSSQFVRPVLLSNLIAWPLAFLVLRHWLEQFPYHVGLAPLDFLMASLVTIAVTGGVIFWHSWITARANASELLRYE